VRQNRALRLCLLVSLKSDRHCIRCEGLIDRLIVKQVLVLFGPLGKDIPLWLVASRSFPGGLVRCEYALATH